MIILGLGAGGCGLASLAWLLQRQHGSFVTKEAAIGWATWGGALSSELALAAAWSQSLTRGASLVGDVGFFHLPYAFELAKRHPNMRIVWLTKDPGEMVDHLVRGAARTHPWHDHVGGWEWNPLNACFPSLGIPDVRAAATLYVEFYERIAVQLLPRLGRQMRRFETSNLDHESGQRSILEFCGVESPVTFPGGVNIQNGRKP